MSDVTPTPPPEDDPSAALAATMGFSSFGASKKRRRATDANTHPTCIQSPSLPPKPPAVAASADEIGLGEDDGAQQARTARPWPGGRPHQRAGGGRTWWADYYDPSSNANPWERLEVAKGLQPAGSWPAAGERAARGQCLA